MFLATSAVSQPRLRLSDDFSFFPDTKNFFQNKLDLDLKSMLYLDSTTPTTNTY
jgi:hypothetical protein